MLNPRQREAVEHARGPLLVAAGPGTGKTRVITEKVVHLTTTLGHPADAILALTFTEKAAEEMAGRIRAALAAAGVKGQPTVSTFHAFCLRLVEEHANRLGYDRPPSLLVGPLYTQFVAEHVDEMATEHTDLVGKVNRFASELAAFASLCHDERLVDEDLCAAVDAWMAKEVAPKDRGAALRVRDLAASLPRLLALQRAKGVASYGDLITNAVRLLRENDDIRAAVQAKHAYVLVDEYQDNNKAQCELVRLLAGGHRNVCVVGDEDQSIYRFRGARAGIMHAFLQEWPGARVVTLEENYRSTAAIIGASQALVARNAGRASDKRLRLADASEARGPARVRLARADTDATERAYVLQEVRRLVREGRAEGDIAILVRSLAHAAPLVQELRRAGVGVEVVGGGGLFSNAAVREVLAWLKALNDPEGDEVALHRLLRMQGFGLSHEDQRALGRRARDEKVPLITLVQRLRKPYARLDGLSGEGHARLRGFLQLHARFLDEARPQGRPDVTGLILEVLDLTGIGRRLRPDDAAGRQGLAALGGLLQAAENYQEHYPYPSLHGFVRHLDLLEELGHDDTVGQASNDSGTVKVMTVHQSKGREFPVVMVPSLERFPPDNRRTWHRKFLDSLTLDGVDVDAVHVEEERRVLYVAATRARSELLLTTARARGGKPLEPSLFEDELLCEHVEAVEVTSSTVEPPGAVADAYRTRRQMEARLTYLVSRLGSHAEGFDVEAAMAESISLVGGLLSEGAEGGAEAVQRVLTKFGIPVPPEVRYLQPDKPKGLVGPLYLSASSLNLYEDCPRQFYYKQVVRIPETAGFEARLGTAIHEALELFHKRHARPDPSHYDELVALFEEKVAQVEFRSEREKSQGLEHGREMLRLYLREEAERGVEVVEVEKEFRVTLGEDVVLAGKIDRLDRLPDGSIRVVDYKTGRLKSRPEYLAEFQMPIYAWAVQEQLGHRLDSVEVIGLKELKETASGRTLQRQVLPWEDGTRYALTQERIEEAKGRVAEIILGIRDGRFDAQPDERRCGWCRYRLLCGNAWGVDGEG